MREKRCVILSEDARCLRVAVEGPAFAYATVNLKLSLNTNRNRNNH